jgi:hypothetical protein
MGYYIIRQEDEFIVESPKNILRIYCDVNGYIKVRKSKQSKGEVQHVKV